MRSAHQNRYCDARRAFVERLGSARHETLVHPLEGPDGPIATELAFWPGAEPDHVLVISSGTHGVEGYCGSFVQCSLLDENFAQRAAEHFSVLMIHGVNPYGFAWQRRVNEQNVDLNRNFIDFSRPLPSSPAYEEIASIVEPSDWSSETPDRIMQELAAVASTHPDDPRWLQAALSSGQYTHAHGQFYGGTEPQWSNLRQHEISQRYLAGKRTIWIDVHTALGEYGDAECIVQLDPASPTFRVADALWGKRLSNLATGGSLSVAVAGAMVWSLAESLRSPMLGAGLEYGTREQTEIIGALIQDQWLHRYGELDGETFLAVKQRMMNAFYPNDPAWRTQILDTAREVTDIPALAEAFERLE